MTRRLPIGSRAGCARGATAVELAAAVALLSVLALLGASLLVSGANACRESVAEQDAVRQAGDGLDSATRELKDATASTVVFSSLDPSRITFQKMVGYDSASGSRILSAPITLRAAPLPGAPGLYGVAREEAGGPASFIAGHLAARDLADPTLPGLHFDVERDGNGRTIVRVTVTIAVPCGPGGPVSVRRSTAISLVID